MLKMIDRSSVQTGMVFFRVSQVDLNRQGVRNVRKHVLPAGPKGPP